MTTAPGPIRGGVQPQSGCEYELSRLYTNTSDRAAGRNYRNSSCTNHHRRYGRGSTDLHRRYSHHPRYGSYYSSHYGWSEPPNATAGASPSFTPFFWNDPLSVGPTQIPPTGPVGSDPLRVGPTQVSGHGGSAASGSSATSLKQLRLSELRPRRFLGAQGCSCSAPSAIRRVSLARTIHQGGPISPQKPRKIVLTPQEAAFCRRLGIPYAQFARDNKNRFLPTGWAILPTGRKGLIIQDLAKLFTIRGESGHL